MNWKNIANVIIVLALIGNIGFSISYSNFPAIMGWFAALCFFLGGGYYK